MPARGQSVIMARRILVFITLIAIGVLAVVRTAQWQTGRLDLAPLVLVPGGPAVAPTGRIWIDTDAACGAAGRTDPDDCLAILRLVSRGANIVGVSTSFGNANGDVVAGRVAGVAPCQPAGPVPASACTLSVTVTYNGKIQHNKT